MPGVWPPSRTEPKVKAFMSPPPVPDRRAAADMAARGPRRRLGSKADRLPRDGIVGSDLTKRCQRLAPRRRFYFCRKSPAARFFYKLSKAGGKIDDFPSILTPMGGVIVAREEEPDGSPLRAC